VGKAINLRSRVRSYFHNSVDYPKVTRMVRHIEEIEFIITDSELEALILEMNLIKRYRPRFNVRLKDDKRYPYIKVHWAADFPTVTITRRMVKDGSRYFGPYTSAWAVHQTLDLLRRIFPYLTCNREITGRDVRACLYFDIKLCGGPCIGAVGRQDYRATIQGLVDFLAGHGSQVIDQLQKAMLAASEELQFERAAHLRDQLTAIRQVVEKQKVVSMAGTDQDVIAFARDDGAACAQVFFIRDGKLIGREHFVLDGTEDEDCTTIISEFVKQFYDDAAYVPPEVLLPDHVAEADIIEQWLAKRRGTKVSLRVPKRGQKRELVKMASTNAAETLSVLRSQWEADQNRFVQALHELQVALGLAEPPGRIECYDISTIQGTATTGSMVVFAQGVPRKSDYRRFIVRGSQASSDLESMRQVLTRRFNRWQATREALPPQKGDAVWALLPDLLVVDGGLGQLGVAVEVLSNVGLLERVPVAALAKQHEEIFIPAKAESILLPRRSQALYLIQRIRDEAHRFAVTHHREQREKAGVASVLDSIPGVGPKRRIALLKTFGSVNRIRTATVEEIAAVPGLPLQVAEIIKALL